MKMNRTEWLVVILCALGLAWVVSSQKPPPRAPQADPAAATALGAATPGTPADPAAPSPEADPPEPDTPAQETVIRNAVAEYTFTTNGAGIREIRVLAGPYAGKTEQILNGSGQGPIGALARGTGNIDRSSWTLQEATDRSVTYTTTRDGVGIVKKWTLSDGADSDGWGYLWKLDVTFRNAGTEPLAADDFYLYSGALGPLHSNDWIRPAATWFADGDAEKREATKFDGSKFLGFLWSTGGPRETIVETPEDMQWGGVFNQYYTVLVSGAGESGVSSLWARRLPVSLEENGRAAVARHALHTGTGLTPFEVAPGAEYSWSGEVFAGPRSGTVLNRIGNDRNAAMHYGMFRSLSRMFLGILNKFHSWVSSYGVAIVMLTFVVRLVIWPLHIKATRAMKRMSKLGPMMTGLKEKYKDDPQKMQVETMKLYREYNVNPVGGCFPLLLQFPIFLGYYYMMQAAVEMRGHPFLWVRDLSMPDTVWTIPGINFPLNPLPIVMAVTMYIQMAVSPKPAETNPQIAMQQKIFKFMPLMFLFFCYSFASALALYWTVQNIISIGQTKLMSLQPEPELKKRPPRPAGSSFMERAMAAQKARQQATRPKGPKSTRTGSGRSTYRKKKD